MRAWPASEGRWPGAAPAVPYDASEAGVVEQPTPPASARPAASSTAMAGGTAQRRAAAAAGPRSQERFLR